MGTPGVKGRRNIWPTSAVPEEGVERKGEVQWGLVGGMEQVFCWLQRGQSTVGDLPGARRLWSFPACN